VFFLGAALALASSFAYMAWGHDGDPDEFQVACLVVFAALLAAMGMIDKSQSKRRRGSSKDRVS
jgi:hypothetical protein